MRKKVIGLTIAGLVALSGVVSAASMWGTYKGNDIVRITINGGPARIADVPAISYNNRTMVPINLLTQFGLDYTWDGTNKTVDVKGYSYKDLASSVNTDSIKAYFRASNMFENLDSTGETIKNLSNDLSLTYSGLAIGKSNFNNTIDHLNTAVNIYNNTRDLVNATVPSLATYGINVSSAANEILNDYYNAIDDYKKAYDGLLTYSSTKNSSDFDVYLTNSSNGFNSAFDGRDLANSNYSTYYKIGINQ